MIANWMKVVGVLSSGAVIATVAASEPISTPPQEIPPSIEKPAPKAPELPELPKLPPVPKLPDLPETPSVGITEVRNSAPSNSGCHPSYSGCLKQGAGDYDCSSGSGNGPNYTGPVQVYGSDPFDLDRDNDGWGCDR